MLDKDLQRIILSLRVQCELREQGCQWEGQLRDIEKHLSVTNDGGCCYIEVECRYECGKRMMRKDMKEHEEGQCLKRPIEVQLLKKMELMWQELKLRETAEISLKAKVLDQEQEIAQLKVIVAGQRKDITSLQEENEKLLQEQKQMALMLKQMDKQTEKPFKLQQSDSGAITFTEVSPDLLHVIPKLMNTTGMVLHPKEGKAQVIATTDEEREKCVMRFQAFYQNILQNRNLRTEDIIVPQNISPHEVDTLVATTNDKYDQCHFSFDVSKSSIHVVSTSSRQFDQAKKVVADGLRLRGKSGGPSSAVLTCKPALKVVTGNQPSGTMTHHICRTPLPGYDDCGTIVIKYTITSGTQGRDHPNPGKQ